MSSVLPVFDRIAKDIYSIPKFDVLHAQDKARFNPFRFEILQAATLCRHCNYLETKVSASLSQPSF